jgi:hypothetical protein
VLALLSLAALVRFLPLFWSPHPATTDGFQYAWFAAETLRTGAFPVPEFRVDSVVFTGLTAAVAAVTGVAPIRAIQPLASLAGVFGVVTGLAVARRVADEFGWSRRRVAVAVLATGVVLAFDGVFLRRTMVADEEVLSYVVFPLALLALHAWLDGPAARGASGRGSPSPSPARPRRRWAWGGLAGLFLVTLPLSHIFSTLVAGLSVVALVVAHAVARPTRRTLLGGGAVAAGFWLYFGGYYQVAATVMRLAYVDRVTAFPGLFLAWAVLLVVGVAWVWTTSSRARALAVVVPLATFYLVTVANAFVSVYPGTPLTPTAVLVPVLALGLPLFFGAVGTATLSPDRPAGAVVVALLAGPLAVVGFSLTASLTPEYVNTAIRGQTFGHLPLAVLAGLLAARVLPARGPGAAGTRTDFGRRPSRGSESVAPDGSGRSAAPGASDATGGRSLLRTAVVCVVLVAVVGSLPFAYVTLDTGTYPATTLDSEFRGVGFADRTGGGWATDHSLSRVGLHYFRSDASPSPTASWLSGGASPSCPVLSQASWTTTGAHLFPFAPETVSGERYDDWLDDRQVVYANTGRDPVTVSLPVSAGGQGC